MTHEEAYYDGEPDGSNTCFINTSERARALQRDTNFNLLIPRERMNGLTLHPLNSNA